MSAAMKARLVGGYGRSEDAGRSPARGARYCAADLASRT